MTDEPRDDDPEFSERAEPRKTRICPDCARQVYADEHHSPSECRTYRAKLDALRKAGGHGPRWLPDGWNG
jgi:hypothetical protein